MRIVSYHLVFLPGLVHGLALYLAAKGQGDGEAEQGADYYHNGRTGHDIAHGHQRRGYRTGHKRRRTVDGARRAGIAALRVHRDGHRDGLHEAEGHEQVDVAGHEHGQRRGEHLARGYQKGRDHKIDAAPFERRVAVVKAGGEECADADGKGVEPEAEAELERREPVDLLKDERGGGDVGEKRDECHHHAQCAHGEPLVAEHTDIKSREQTVKIIEIEKVKGVYKKDKPDEPEKPEEPERKRSPDTGDNRSLNLLYYLTALSVSAEALLLTKKRRNDRLN